MNGTSRESTSVRFGVLLVTAILSCGGGAAPPHSSAPPAASAPDAPESKETDPATPSAQADEPAPVEPCLSVGLEQRPAAPTEEVGTITVHIGKDCTIEARSADGATKAKEKCGEKLKAASLRPVACKLGGDVFWLNGAPPSEAHPVMEAKVGRYTKPDEAADLKLVCAPFSSLKDRKGKLLDEKGVDPSQRARIRAQVLEESMTSKKWRLWLHDAENNRDGAIAALREAAKAAHLPKCDNEWLK